MDNRYIFLPTYNKKNVIWKYLNIFAHAFKLAKEEEKELLVMDSLSKEFNYPINEVSVNTPSQ